MWSAATTRLVAQLPAKGIFLTSLEGYDLDYEDRLTLIRDLGLNWLFFGPSYSEAHPAQDEFDFAYTDQVVAKAVELGITIVVNLLSSSLPPSLPSSLPDWRQNSYFPFEFAKYAARFAERYPSIQYYTVVNEPFVAATSWLADRDFGRAVANIAKAAVLARRAVESVGAEPIFCQTERLALAIAAPGSGREAEAYRFNQRRFAALDLIFGHADPAMKEFLLAQGLSAADYAWFMDRGRSDKTILGINHYATDIHRYEADQLVDDDRSSPSRLLALILEYADRYPLPLLYTAVKARPEQTLQLCQETYDMLGRLRTHGCPVVGMGWSIDDATADLFATLAFGPDKSSNGDA